MVVFQALTWEAKDTNENEHHISIFGRSEDGKSVCVTTKFEPYFFVKVATNISSDTLSCMYQKIQKCATLPVRYELVKMKDVWGFQNNEKSCFMKLIFCTLRDRRRVDYALRKMLPEENGLYESNIDPVLRLMHKTGIQATGWLDTGDACLESCIASTTLDLFCSDWKTLRPVARDDIAPFIIGSFDIECYSSTGKFPNPEVEGDCCFQIAFSLLRFGESEPFLKTCLCYKKTAPIDGAHIISFDSEKELLEGFQSYLMENDIDIMTGWNIFGFDLDYIFKRALVCKCDARFYNMSKLYDFQCELVEKKLSSSALGDNLLKLIPMPGRFIFDMFHEVKRGYKLDSYSLNAVSKQYLGDQKIDMPAKEMFAIFKEGHTEKLRDVAAYCIKDTLLPHKLIGKLYTLMNLLEMAKATWVPLSFLVERGQQIKVFSQLAKKAREMGFMLPALPYGSTPSEKYEGATVLEAQTGAYYRPITALDFEGLYPSIMMAHNLCYSSLVTPGSKYDNIPGVEYEVFGEYKFAQGVPSLLPSILLELKQFRKQAKKDMAAASPAMKPIYNGKQLAYKVSMNSVYGFTGASRGILPCVPIAATVTMKGRSMIEDTKQYVETNFPGAKVRYGDTDSVMVEFDVGDRTGEEAIAYSWELGERAAKACTTLFKKPNNLELEKVYCPYFLYSKKRYAAKLWTKGKDEKMHMEYIDVKGLQVVRRDNTPFVREVCKELLDAVMNSSDPEPVKILARERAQELLRGDVPMEKLILSKQLGDHYKNANQPHVMVRNKMRERQPGSEPQSGDRVPFVLVDIGDPKAKGYERADDPKWVQEHDLPIDYAYYFTNKFMNPVCDLLEPLVDRDVIFAQFLAEKKVKKDKNAGQTKLEDFFKAYAVKK